MDEKGRARARKRKKEGGEEKKEREKNRGYGRYSLAGACHFQSTNSIAVSIMVNATINYSNRSITQVYLEGHTRLSIDGFDGNRWEERSLHGNRRERIDNDRSTSTWDHLVSRILDFHRDRIPRDS